VAGYLSALPSVFWASGALMAAAFLLLVPLAIWIYSVIFAFTSLWFAHYTLTALRDLRAEPLAAEATTVSPGDALALPHEHPSRHP